MCVVLLNACSLYYASAGEEFRGWSGLPRLRYSSPARSRGRVSYISAINESRLIRSSSAPRGRLFNIDNVINTNMLR